eukprot:2851611-Rhodomonas_salina.1
MAFLDGVLTFSLLRDRVWQPAASSSYTPVQNTWFHVAITVSGSTITFYIDGLQVAQKTSGVPRTILRNVNYVGRSAWSAAEYLHGQLADFRVYARALSAPEAFGVSQGYTTYAVDV